MRSAFITATLLLALILEWSFKAAGWFSPPLVATLLIFWFWRINLSSRFWLASFTGFLLDGVSILPFGTHLLIFWGLALGAEFLQRLFSNVKSPLTQGLGILVLLALFLVAAPQLARFLNVIT